jgi:hypothetical protein
VLRLAFLTPNVVDAFMAGRQAQGVTVGRLVATEAIDPDWATQRRALVMSRS